MAGLLTSGSIYSPRLPGLDVLRTSALFDNSYLLFDLENYRRIINPSGFISLPEADDQIASQIFQAQVNKPGSVVN